MFLLLQPGGHTTPIILAENTFEVNVKVSVIELCL